MSDKAFILISESSGSPVPLPFHTLDDGDQPVTIRDFRSPNEVFVTWDDSECRGWYEWIGLKVITEAEYMESQT